MTSAAVTLDLGSWSGEIGFDVVGPYGDTLLSHTAGSSLTSGYSFGSFLAYCSSCAIVTSLPYTENFDDTTSWVVNGYNGVFDACWTPTPSTGFVYRWVSSTGGTPSSGLLVHCQALAEQVNTSTQSPRMELLELLQR